MRALPAILFLVLANASAAVAAEVQGRLEWARRVVLSVPVSGVVTEVNVRPGEVVRQGQTLLKLDQRGFSARLKAAEATLAGLKHAHGEAQRELERAEELYQRMLLSDHDLVQAKVAFGDADAAFHNAQARLAEAQMNLQYSEIRAPFDGVVVNCRADVGQTVAADFQSVSLIDLAESGRMAAVAAVPPTRLAKLRLGARAAVGVDGERYDGTVDALGTEPLQDGGEAPLYPVRVVFDNGGKRLLPGQSAKIVLP